MHRSRLPLIKKIMREIKFRAYVPNKGWVQGFNLINCHDYYTKGLEPKISRYNSEWDIKDIHLMQFTGLKDKNGVDIYDGDVLRDPPLTDWDKVNYNCYEVFFHDNDCCSYHIGWQMDRMHCHGSVGGGYTPPFKPANVSKLEIIGNIYENPELLTPTK